MPGLARQANPILGAILFVSDRSKAFGNGPVKAPLSPEMTGAAAVKHFVRSGDVVLIKASRASRLDRVGEALRGDRKK